MNDQAEKLRKIISTLKQKNMTITQRIVDEALPEASVKKHARIITITSGKGGVGKTNITANLALALTDMGHRVVIFDADFGLANVDLLFGIVPEYSLADMILNGKNILNILAEGPRGVKFISGGSGVEELVRLDSQQLGEFVRNIGLLDSIADFILIDTGAGLSDNVLSFVLAADEILLVTTPEPTAITDAYALIKMVSFRDRTKNIKMVVNRAESAREGKEILNRMSMVAEKFLKIKLHPLGFVLQDEAVKIAVKTQQPFYIEFPKSQASRHIRDISSKLLESGSLEENITETGIRRFVGKLVGFLGN